MQELKMKDWAEVMPVSLFMKSSSAGVEGRRSHRCTRCQHIRHSETLIEHLDMPCGPFPLSLTFNKQRFCLVNQIQFDFSMSGEWGRAFRGALFLT